MILYHEPQRGGWTLKLNGRRFIGLSAFTALRLIQQLAPSFEHEAMAILYPE